MPIQVDGLTPPTLRAPDTHLEQVLASPTARRAATVAFGPRHTTRPVIRALAHSLRAGQPGQPVDLFPLTLAMALASRLDPDRLTACMAATNPDITVREPLTADERDMLARATAATGPRRLLRVARALATSDDHRIDLMAEICPLLAELHPPPGFDIVTVQQLHRATCHAWGVAYGRHRPLRGSQAVLAGLDGRALDGSTKLVVPHTVAEFDQAAANLANCLWRYPPVVSQPSEIEGVLLVVRAGRLIAAASVTGRDVCAVLGPSNTEVASSLRRHIIEAVLAGAGPRTGTTAWRPTDSDRQQPSLW